MNEIEQIQELLASQSGFWEEEDRRGWEIGAVNGIAVEIVEDANRNFRWRAVWVNRSKSESSELFRSVQEAKADLRKAVEVRLSKLIDENPPPTQIETM